MGGEEVEARPVRRGFTAQDFIQRPELIMAIAAILMIIGAFGEWSSQVIAVSGWDVAAGKATVFMSLIMLYSAVADLGYIRFMRGVVPVLSVSTVCGSVALVLALATWDFLPNGGWGLYLTIVASLITLFAAFRAYTQAWPGPVRRGGGL